LGGVTHSKLKRRRRRFSQNAGKQGGVGKNRGEATGKAKTAGPSDQERPRTRKIKYDATV